MAHACPYTVTATSYVLEVLCAQESDEFRQHAEVCPYCRREIAELTPIARHLETLKAETQAANEHAPWSTGLSPHPYQPGPPPSAARTPP